MKIQARILGVKDNFIKAQVGKPIFKMGDKVSIIKGSQRSISQNSFYWLYLTYVIENGAEEYGHFDPYGLHLSLKQHFLASKQLSKGEWKELEEATTTDLSKSEFGEYMEKVDHFVNETFGIDTSPFFADYENIFKPEWK